MSPALKSLVGSVRDGIQFKEWAKMVNQKIKTTAKEKAVAN